MPSIIWQLHPESLDALEREGKVSLASGPHTFLTMINKREELKG